MPEINIGSPADGATFEPGASIGFSATATDTEDGDLSGSIVWTAAPGGSLGTGASVDTSSLAAGSHVVTATVTDGGGRSASAHITITVNETPAVHITAPATGATAEPGASVAFTGSASDAEDGDLTANIVWTSSLDGEIGTGGSFSRDDLSTGTHTITAAVTDAGGKTDSAQITVTIDATPVAQITAPADGLIAVPGTSLGFTGSASDAEEGDLSASLVWTSSLDGEIGTGGSFNRDDLSLGTHTITAEVTDAGGKTHSAQITITIDAVPTVQITAPTSGSSFGPGTVSFTANATDAEDGSLTVHWSSDLDGPLGDGASLGVDTLSVGTHVITASVMDSAGHPAADQITVEITP